METDICICSKTKADHANALATGSCLAFAIDRKATYWAEKRAGSIARSVKLAEDIRSGRVRRICAPEDMVTREAVKCDGNHAAPACADAECWHGQDLLGALAKRLGMEPAR